MASLTKLRRRVRRWQRYDDRCRAISPSLGDWYDIDLPPGHRRASLALHAERVRRYELTEQRFELAEPDWCCGGDECAGHRLVVDEVAFARLGIL